MFYGLTLRQGQEDFTWTGGSRLRWDVLNGEHFRLEAKITRIGKIEIPPSRAYYAREMGHPHLGSRKSESLTGRIH